jgi:O-antigen ligase
MEYALFALVNLALFVRPSEIFPALATVPVYNILISTCLLANIGPVIGLLSGRALARSPVAVCIVGLLAMVVLSHAAHFNLNLARYYGVEFLKIVVYFLLLLTSVNTVSRLNRFLNYYVILAVVLVGVAVLHYHKVIHIPTIQVIERGDEVDPRTGEPLGVAQLSATGMYSDPNDLCALLVVVTVLALYRLADRRSGLTRLLWAAPIGLFVYALVLTGSRGGLIALLAALGTLLLTKFGWRKSVPLAVLVLPALLVVAGGRQTRISTGEGTAQQRLQFWVEAFQMIKRSPVVGIGPGMFQDEVGLVAHNSFMHANAEVGLVGGAFFLGLFYVPVRSLRRLGADDVTILDDGMKALRPFLLAAIVGLAVSLLTISRCYAVITYTAPGLAAAYTRVVPVRPPDVVPRFDGSLAWGLARANFVLLAALYVFVRMTVRF